MRYFRRAHLVGLISSSILDRLVETFKMGVDRTEEVLVSGQSCRIFRVKGFPSDCEVYIVDSDAGKEVACHPSIVGERLAKLCLEMALDAVKAILEFTPLREYGGDSIVFEHVLRAAPGYRLHEAFRDAGLDFREVWVRPRYVTPSYSCLLYTSPSPRDRG